MPDPTAMETALSTEVSSIERLKAIMEVLRSDTGCPWDREQSLETLKPFLVEEAYEVIDAIDSGDPKALEEELGDLLLQVVFQSQICREEGRFTFDDVAERISEKLVRRHPHVFGDVDVADADEVLRNWEEIKKSEKGEEQLRSVLHGIPRHLPALFRAQQVQARAARQGFDWDHVDHAFAKVDEELRELHDAIATKDEAHVKEELGDILFAVVNVSRFLEHSAEEALTTTIHKFMRRFQEIEERVVADGKSLTDCTLEELDTIWEDVKKAE